MTARTVGGRNRGLHGIAFWSLDRDRPCEGGAAIVSPTCSGLAELPPGGYTRLFAETLGQGR